MYGIERAFSSAYLNVSSSSVSGVKKKYTFELHEKFVVVGVKEAIPDSSVWIISCPKEITPFVWATGYFTVTKTFAVGTSFCVIFTEKGFANCLFFVIWFGVE